MKTIELIAACAEFIRQKKLRSCLKQNPVVCTCIQLVGNSQQLAGADASMAAPVDDRAGAGDVVVRDPACPLHSFKCSPQMEVVFRSIDHKRRQPYINRYGVQMPNVI